MLSCRAAASAESSARMRSISLRSATNSSRSSLLPFTALIGSMKNVLPEDDTSCTSPGSWLLHSALTGTTKRSERIVTIGSCKIFAYVGDVMIFCKDSRILLLCCRIFRRIEASSLLAASAISSFERMDVKMRSSKNLFGVSCRKKMSRPLSTASPSAYSFAVRAALRTVATRSSSSGLRQPPRSARLSDAPTSTIPPKLGEPLSVMSLQAALVCACNSRISSASSSGRTARHRSFAAGLEAWSASSASTLSSSSFVSDF